jgi:FtsP/CotA-like multicopper oxidase with cupredoxin domain
MEFLVPPLTNPPAVARFLSALLSRAALACVLAASGALAQSAPARRVALSISNDQVSGPGLEAPARGAPTLRVERGEQIELRWSADAPMELHLHGYKQEVRVAPGEPVLMAFSARATGRFPVETHDRGGRHRAILYIEVHPR